MNSQPVNPDPMNPDPVNPDPTGPAPDSGGTALNAPAGQADRRPLLLGLVGLVLVIGIGLIIWRVFAGGASGGAASPEEAMQQLIDSVGDRDAVGLAEIINPDEIDGWISSFVPAAQTSSNEGAGEGPLGDQQEQVNELAKELIDTLGIAVTALDGESFTLTSTDLDPDGRIAAVRVDGFRATLQVNSTTPAVAVVGLLSDPVALDLAGFDGSSLTLTDGPGGMRAQASSPDLGELDETIDGLRLEVVMVERDGAWFVSPGYTVAHQLSSPLDLDLDYGRGYRLIDDQTGGADGPEDVVRQLMAALEELDHDAAFDLTDPATLPWLHDMRHIVDDAIDPALVADAADEIELDISTLDLTSSAWNDRTLVIVDRIGGGVSGGTFDLDTSTWCASAVSPDGEQVEGCASELVDQALAEADIAVDSDVLPDHLGLVVVERNGRWFFDPLGTLGYLSEQIADAATALEGGVTDRTTGEEFGTDQLPYIARLGDLVAAGETISAEPALGAAAVAIDLGSITPIQVEGSNARFALARIDAAAGSRLPQLDDRATSDADWFVAYRFDDEQALPAIVVATDEPVSASVETLDITPVSADGLTDGRIDDDGKPLLLRFEDPSLVYEFTSVDATFETISNWAGVGVVGTNGAWASPFGDPAWGALTVVTGPPGATFAITAPGQSITDTDTADATDTDNADDNAALTDSFGDDRVDRFAETIAAAGYTEFAFDQAGGYFDGCGPNNPEASTYAFDDGTGEFLLITVYESAADAAGAFDALTEMTSPCEFFPGLSIDEVVLDGLDSDRPGVILTLSTAENPTEPFFEYYTLRGDTIVVATALSTENLLYGAAVLADFSG